MNIQATTVWKIHAEGDKKTYTKESYDEATDLADQLLDEFPTVFIYPIEGERITR